MSKNIDKKLLALANDLDYWEFLNSSDTSKIKSERDFLQTILLIKMFFALEKQNKIMTKLEKSFSRIADNLGEK